MKRDRAPDFRWQWLDLIEHPDSPVSARGRHLASVLARHFLRGDGDVCWPGRRKVSRIMRVGSNTLADSYISDEPWRGSSWIEYARQYGFKGPKDWRRLLDSDDPAVVRVRDDIAQRVRDDMLDFDALPPWARENLSRAFFIFPFRYAAAKCPAMYVREHPTRAAMLALIAAQHEREETPGRVTSVLESGRTEIGGRELDLGWLLPHAPAAETAEDLADAAGGLDPDNLSLRPLAGMLSPQYRLAVDAGGFSGEPTEQIAGWTVPGYSTVDKIGRGGGTGEQVLRGLGSTIEYVEEAGGSSTENVRQKVRDEARVVIAGLRAHAPEELRDPEVRQAIRRAYNRKQAVEVVRAEVRADTDDREPYFREALKREIELLRKWGEADEEDLATVMQIVAAGSVDEVKAVRDEISGVFKELYRDPISELEEAAGVSP